MTVSISLNTKPSSVNRSTRILVLEAELVPDTGDDSLGVGKARGVEKRGTDRPRALWGGTRGQYQLQPFSFVVPAGSHGISIIGTLVVQTKYWYLNNRADAWLEIPNVVASGNARITGGPYNSVRTASLRIDTTLAGGTYACDWGMLLQSGNRVQIQGGAIDVWQNT